ncbi:hypothetical protein [Candidatus Binatus soli]|jgi:hypothetical protein|uniref:hypothetical protein n=1 Tax=Candidatus Binatus soli TaxID=1953413 RepID=UPI003D0ED59C
MVRPGLGGYQNIEGKQVMKKLALMALLATVMVAPAAIAADGSEKSVTGNLEDAYCYATMGAKGASHKACAIKCVSKGIPVMLIESGTEKSYILLPDKDASPLPDSVIQRMEDRVTVTGKEYSRNGVNYLVVESVK